MNLYRCYDKDNVLLYIGITLRISVRFSAHRQKADWFDNVRTIKIEPCLNRQMALQKETVAIQTESPLFNIAKTKIAKIGKIVKKSISLEEKIEVSKIIDGLGGTGKTT